MHRDVKGQNVLLTNDARVRLIDFGRWEGGGGKGGGRGGREGREGRGEGGSSRVCAGICMQCMHQVSSFEAAVHQGTG